MQGRTREESTSLPPKNWAHEVGVGVIEGAPEVSLHERLKVAGVKNDKFYHWVIGLFVLGVFGCIIDTEIWIVVDPYSVWGSVSAFSLGGLGIGSFIVGCIYT